MSFQLPIPNGVGAPSPTTTPRSSIPFAFKALSVFTTMLGAWHGYARNRSVGSAVLWAIATGLFWPIAIPVMLVQGPGKPKPGLAGQRAEQITKWTPKGWKKRAKRQAAKAQRRAGKRYLDRAPKRVTRGWAD